MIVLTLEGNQGEGRNHGGTAFPGFGCWVPLFFSLCSENSDQRNELHEATVQTSTVTPILFIYLELFFPALLGCT